MEGQKHSNLTSAVSWKERSVYMFQRILVPVDGSSRAEQAVLCAARLARATGGSLVLLRVITHVRDAVLSLLQPPEKAEEHLEAQHAQAVAYLTHLATASELTDLKPALEIADSSPEQTILSAARLQQVDSIILCSHGTTGLTHWALGSVAQKVAHQSPVPVLLLREKERPQEFLHAPPAARPLRALVALDGSAGAEAALLSAATLVSALSAPAHGELSLVLVLTSMEPREAFQSEQEQRVKHRAEAYLEAVKQRLNASLGSFQIHVTTAAVVGEDVATTLLQRADQGDSWEKRRGCDVIAMATHGRGGTALWALGSVTERVLGATSHPLLIVPSIPHQQE